MISLRRMISRRAGLAAVVFTAALPTATVYPQASASASLLGTVFIDTTDAPLSNAEIVFPKLNLSTRTDSAGNFQIAGIPAGSHELIVRRIGYQPFAATITFRQSQKVEADFLLQSTVTKLARVDVTASVNPRYAIRLADFEERRKIGTGRFLTSEVFERAVGQNMSQVLVSLIPGVRTSGKSSKQILVSRRSGKDCAVQVIVNGMVQYNGGDPNYDLNSLYTANVIGIEYYTVANTPSQFNATARAQLFDGIAGGSHCGTIVIWTK